MLNNFNNDTYDSGINIVREIIKKFGGRAPGSFEERECAKFIADLLKENVDEVSLEEFTFHPKAFLGFINIVIFLYIASLVSLRFLNSVIAFVLSFTGFIILFEEFFCYREFIDPIFPEKSSYNVVGKFSSSGDSEKIIIISGHHDSAFEFRLLEKSPYLYLFIVITSILGAYLLLITTVLAIASDVLIFLDLINISNLLKILVNYLWYLLLIILPIMLPMFFFTSDKAVPGAVDNLSSVATILEISKTLKDKGIRFDKTEIWLVSFGGEEAGLRGSRRFVKKHYDLLKSKDTYVINLEMLAKPIDIQVLVKEKTTRTKHSEELANMVMEVAKKKGYKGIKVEMPSIGGGTDATSFSRAGIKAVTLQLTKYNIDTFKYYHTRRDTVDKIDPKALKLMHDFLMDLIDYIAR